VTSTLIPIATWLSVVLLAPPAIARAEERPSEAELFEGPASAERPSGEERPAPTSQEGAAAQDADAPGLERDPGAAARLLQSVARTDDPLQVGGLLYLRLNLGARQGTPPSQWTLSSPNLTDVYLDARPTDRVRGFVLGRLQFDPTQGSTAASAPGLNTPGASTASNPRVLLDQLWLQFDVARTAFVTMGRQHVKWGVGHFWNPTDYLHAVRLNPLAVFDDRTGTFMARVGVPWESHGWNFYGMAVLEPLVTGATPLDSTSSANAGQASSPAGAVASGQLARVGAAARAEVVFGSWELGLDGVVQRGIRPRFGVDLSGGIWELDVRAELGLRTSSDVPLYRGTSSADAVPHEPKGVRPMLVLGTEWSHKYSDEDSFTVGVEYFHNSNGYADAALYPVLLFGDAFTPFYLGRHYAGAYVQLPRPGGWNLHTFALSLIANLSDRTGIARLDWNMTALTYLTVEAYLQGHFGASGGEFRLSLDVPAGTVPGVPTGFTLTPPTVDAGVALRLKL
jgi:hypothetical protein